MWEYANGIDNSPLNPDTHELKGIGNSTTLASDATTAEEAKKVLLALSEQVALRLRRSHQIAQTVTVEIKYSTFQACSRQTQLLSPGATSGLLYGYACRLFDELWNGSPIRLLGIRTSRLLSEDADVYKRQVLKPGQTLFDLYQQRRPLYEKYAHITVNVGHRSVSNAVAAITGALADSPASGTP